ncbi:MAG: polyribonucleotide nucleotidyltransferase [bacterium]
MNGSKSVEVEVGGKTITLETGLLALQANGAALVKLGETVVFSAVTAGVKPKEGQDYFPLQVEYREKYYAAGRFPGGYIKRETRPSEKEILTARLTDRPLRPLFPETYRCEVQINSTLLSFDDVNDSDILNIVAASTALTLSELPFLGPVAAVRVGRVDGKFIINPTHEERAKSDFDMVYAATKDYPLMIEGGANEMSETDIVAAMRAAHAETAKLIDAQIRLRKHAGLPDKNVVDSKRDTTILESAREIIGTELTAVLLIGDKCKRHDAESAAKEKLHVKLLEKYPDMTHVQFADVYDDLKIDLVRKNALDKGLRIDGRPFDKIRPLVGQVGVLPRIHGSALFNRGETQALMIATLGSKSDTQRMDAIAGGPEEKKFMLHYNFPPYSVGEVGRLGSTGRREIGHGALAERSLRAVVPEDCPYTIRLVSEIMGSNGSSSMASVCAGTLALMDAGINIRKPVAGIAIGLFSDDTRAKVAMDMIGEEDHCGDMDFKVAGTRDGITGFQVDLKIRGLRWDLVEAAFAMARTGRLQILDYMATVISQSRADVSKYAPRIHTLKIDPEKIGALIGPGGKNIRRITDLSGAQIDIEDDGTISIFATNKEAMEMALREVEMIVAEVKEGVTYNGTVVSIMPFGAFVEVLPGMDGLVHISELADFRVNKVEDVCKIGDPMTVKCIGVDDRGRVRLSRRAAMQDSDAAAKGGDKAPAPVK